MGNKTGWGEARDGKVHTEDQDNYGDYMTDVKSSKELKGLYAKYQGKTLTGESAS